MARAGLAAGADGIHIEVHSCPELALSDGPQALLPAAFAKLMGELRPLIELLGRSIGSRIDENASAAAAAKTEVTV
jgi:3-deoxy-7-phosphoheptulonate synthase